MISIDWQKNIGNNTSQFSFIGLSSDSKPVGSYEGAIIYNGSSFFEMDTGDVYMYNQEDSEWLQF